MYVYMQRGITSYQAYFKITGISHPPACMHMRLAGKELTGMIVRVIVSHGVTLVTVYYVGYGLPE